MGKIVKYCSSCDEGFAEKFGFCPDCGAQLQAFELNPITGEATGEGVPATNVPEEQFERPPETETFNLYAEEASVEPEPQFEAVPAADEVDEPKNDVIPATAAWSYGGESIEPEPEILADAYEEYLPDDDYHITVIEDKNTGQRNSLLLGATAFMLITMLSMTVYSIFNRSFDIGSIGDDDLFAFVPQLEPDAVEIPEPEPKKKDDSGGGGGGGQEDPEPAAKGKPPAMMDKPDVAPDVNMDRLTTPTIVPRVGVQGPTQPKVDPYSRYGLLNGLDNNSNGPGTGGGIGTGRGGGVGSGTGSGLGSGSGGGAGSGTGGGIGSGSGSGGPPGPPPAVIRESTPVKIISKPKAPYTDQARQNNVQGSVTLKITFLANGQVGGVTAVTRLPYGLTENAIAAAKQIRVEPKKVNGVPVTTTMTFQYGFNIY
jgi:TonB family protein